MSPYRRALPRDLGLEQDPLLLRLDVHRESLILHEYAEATATSRLVSALDVAKAVASELDLDTGVLPAEALWYLKTASGPRVAIWSPAAVRTVKLRETYGQPPRRFRLPMPGLVFICLPSAQAPYVFAAKSRPRTAEEDLYHAPTFNVFRNGRVCPGTHVFPRDPSRMPDEFFRSHFSPAGDTIGRSRSHPDDLLGLWSELHRQSAYPLDDLVPAMKLADALRVGH
jgi:PRTRC genetic system protein B